MIGFATVFESLKAWSRDFLSWLTTIPTAAWVLFGIALLAALWAYSIMYAATRLGPIEVDDLKADGANGSSTKPVLLLSLAAEFRQRLWHVGLAPPPAVPEGSPQANLVEAIEAVGPPGTAIGKFLELLPTPPRPARYKVTATLTGTELGPAFRTCGVSYALLPLGRGDAHLETTKPCGTHADALHTAAIEIYLHIAKSLPDVFPTWVRWRSPEALGAYLVGCKWRTDRELDSAALDQAAERLEYAISESPFNALAALQLGNLEERRASSERPGANHKWRRAYFQARALSRYLDTARTWPSVVEARYRTSVVSSSLAATYGKLNYAVERQAIRAMVPLFSPSTARLADDDEYASRLRNLADLESRAAVQLLSRFHVIVRELRLRNQFESKGRDRWRLRNGVRISRNCAKMRWLNGNTNSGLGWTRWINESTNSWLGWLRWLNNSVSRRPSWMRWLNDTMNGVPGWDARVRAANVMVLSWRSLSWQARYNIACFEALRLAGPYVSKKRRARVERRALRNLGRASRESAGALTRTWIENDPDMTYFLIGATPAGAAEWRVIVDRAPKTIVDDPLRDGRTVATAAPTTVTTSSTPPATQSSRMGKPVPSAVDVIRRDPGPLATTMPARPWGNATARWLLWGAAALLIVGATVAGVLLVGTSKLAAVVAVLGGVLFGSRALTAGRERGLSPNDQFRATATN